MTVTVHTDPAGTITAKVAHPGQHPNYTDGTAQAIKAAATRAIADQAGQPIAAIRTRIALAAGRAGASTTYALHAR